MTDLAAELRDFAENDVRALRRDQHTMGALIDDGDLTVWADLMDKGANEIDRLRDALSGLIDWCSEGCPDGAAISLIDAKAAIAGISLVKPNT